MVGMSMANLGMLELSYRLQTWHDDSCNSLVRFQDKRMSPKRRSGQMQEC